LKPENKTLWQNTHLPCGCGKVTAADLKKPIKAGGGKSRPDAELTGTIKCAWPLSQK
jgi:hypothetical protein